MSRLSKWFATLRIFSKMKKGVLGNRFKSLQIREARADWFGAAFSQV